MNEKEYLILISPEVRKRHYHATEGGKIIRFMVQLEAKVGAAWKEVVRYDCAHDYVHKDSYNMKGRSRKIGLNLTYQDALTFADDDIADNWQIYHERFLRGEFP